MALLQVKGIKPFDFGDLSIIKYPDHRLRVKAKYRYEWHKPSVYNLAHRMQDLLRRACGLALAATQVGVDFPMFVTHTEIYINPEILMPLGRKSFATEGCLSIPDMVLDVERHERLQVLYHNGHELFRRLLLGTEARIFQHELDHLKGRLIIDYGV